MVTVYRGVVSQQILYPASIVITTKNLDDIDFNKVIYCERSNRGAMGHPGSILLYILKDEANLITYEANVSIDNQVYKSMLKKIEENSDLFDLYYGGFGNYVHIKKGIKLDVDMDYDCFWYYSKNTKLRIDSSVQGVFLKVADKLGIDK